MEKEREIYRQQMADQKKPPQVLDKIIEGKLEKFYAETCLLEQPFIQDATRQDRVKDLVDQVTPRSASEIVGEALRAVPGRRGLAMADASTAPRTAASS